MQWFSSHSLIPRQFLGTQFRSSAKSGPRDQPTSETIGTRCRLGISEEGGAQLPCITWFWSLRVTETGPGWEGGGTFWQGRELRSWTVGRQREHWNSHTLHETGEVRNTEAWETVIGKLVPWPQCPFANKRIGVWGKGTKVNYGSDKEEDRQHQPLKALLSHSWE
jgi:hypothetical protein